MHQHLPHHRDPSCNLLPSLQEHHRRTSHPSHTSHRRSSHPSRHPSCCCIDNCCYHRSRLHRCRQQGRWFRRCACWCSCHGRLPPISAHTSSQAMMLSSIHATNDIPLFEIGTGVPALPEVHIRGSFERHHLLDEPTSSQGGISILNIRGYIW